MSIKLENVVLASPEQMEFIIEGMRNPMNSWEKSDSEDCCVHSCRDDIHNCPKGGFTVGPNDRSLMQRLSNAGTEHRKYMRMMPVYVRITAPLYWWKEFDTYKVGTVANSCSTMHKIAEKRFTLKDFSCEHLIGSPIPNFKKSCHVTEKTTDGNAVYSFGLNATPYGFMYWAIDVLNAYRALYLETKDKTYWWQMIQLLPSSYNQTRNVMMNYEVLANIYRQRVAHKLDEWREFCSWIETLPYSELIIGLPTLLSNKEIEDALNSSYNEKR